MLDARGATVLSELVDDDGDESPDELVFQTDFAPRETKAFKLVSGKRALPAPADFKVYGRFVRERHDDFAWENDRVAHRIYGPGLETYAKDSLTSSGIDVWVKRVPKLIVNEWYMTDDYHQDHGEGADFYSVGKSRGCGGVGIWTGGALVSSRNFTGSRVLANGPVRLVFELTYAPWDAGGAKVSETKRVTLDAGTAFNRIESTFVAPGDALGRNRDRQAPWQRGEDRSQARLARGLGTPRRRQERPPRLRGDAATGLEGAGRRDGCRVPAGDPRFVARSPGLLRRHDLGPGEPRDQPRGLAQRRAGTRRAAGGADQGQARGEARSVSRPQAGYQA